MSEQRGQRDAQEEDACDRRARGRRALLARSHARTDRAACGIDILREPRVALNRVDFVRELQQTTKKAKRSVLALSNCVVQRCIQLE